MQRVTGLGGVFFKSKVPKQLAEWYRKHLGMNVEEWGGLVFRWNTDSNPSGTGSTIWSLFADTTEYFAPSDANFLIPSTIEQHREYNLRRLAVKCSEPCAPQNG